MKPDQERVKNLLTDTVTLLCKNGLHYQKELKVQGLLGITTDEDEVFIVHINEKFGDLIGSVGFAINTKDNDAVSDIAALSRSSHRDRPKKSKVVDLTDKETSASKHGQPTDRNRARKRQFSEESRSSPNVSSSHSYPSPRSTQSQPSSTALPSPQYYENDNSTRQSPMQSPKAAQPTVKIKEEKEDEDVMIVDRKPFTDGRLSRDQSNVAAFSETDAMHQSYGSMGLPVDNIQGGFQQFEYLDQNVSERLSPAKRSLSSSVYVSSSSSQSATGTTVTAPAIMGLVENVANQASLDYEQSPGVQWDNSNLGPLTHDGQIMLEGAAPGCSTWSPSQLQAGLSQGGTESSESICKLPNTHIGSKSIKDSLIDSLVRPLVYDQGCHVMAIRITWRMARSRLDAAWNRIVGYRQRCDDIVRNTDRVAFFVSSITGIYTKTSANVNLNEVSIYPGISYWIITQHSDFKAQFFFDKFSSLYPEATVKNIMPTSVDTNIHVTLSSISAPLFVTLKDHSNSFTRTKVTQSSMILGTGPMSIAKLILVDSETYGETLWRAWTQLRQNRVQVEYESP